MHKYDIVVGFHANNFNINNGNRIEMQYQKFAVSHNINKQLNSVHRKPLHKYKKIHRNLFRKVKQTY